MLFCLSIIIFAMAIRYQTSQDCCSNKSEHCKSNKYALSLGACGFVIMLSIIGMIYFKALNVYVESGIVVVFLGLYAVSVALITSENGSGAAIGNLYFSTWIGFLITAFLSVDTCHTCMDWVAKQHASKKASWQATREAREKVEEVKVSNIDENDFYEAKNAKESKHFKYISNA